MPARVDRPFRPIHRTLRIALTVSIVFTLFLVGSGHSAAESVLKFVGTFALALGMGAFLFREDFAEMVRARRED